MSYESYPVAGASDDHSLYEFTSVGPRGRIKKVVAFMPAEDPRFFSLAFGDVRPDSSTPDDKVVTDNGDRDKVLATVAEIVDLYTRHYPERWIYFRGSTRERTRLYRMAVTLNLEALASKYEIYTVTRGEDPQPFVKGASFDFFLFQRKNS
ncbi:hypothetical protein KK062_27560 [Fulvivirgaceae bacterium PWU5]|uniref:Uncharacterized protein n=1 Tax=Dawidia cretensis TaxID=2782350 RepID=A0AAP2E4E9_9BACT|nr:hypothetical protein [Dawidia cretensis]MBT1712029.1 hypothetical protein [Dawidia cretensis]